MAQSFGPWTASIHEAPRPFSDRRLHLDDEEGTVGGDALLGS